MDPFDAVRQSCDADRPLPGAAYRDSAIFEAEAATLFRDSWISVACGQNVAEPGDLFPVRITGQSLLVLRDAEAEIRVFYNLCRHRGSPLTDVPCRARAGRILCPYHAWSYGLDGQLLAAPHYYRRAAPQHHRQKEASQPGPEERAGLGLLPVRTAVWRDIVFVNLSGEAPPFQEFIRPLDERLAPWTASELRPLSSDEYEIQANWKLAAENFLDNYHLPVVHSQLVGGFSGALKTEDVEVADEIIGLVLPDGYGEGWEQEESLLPRFSGLGADEQTRVEVFSVFPNTLILVEPDNQQVIVLRPQASGVTLETFANYVVSGAVVSGAVVSGAVVPDAFETEELAKERDELRRQAVEVNDQDAVLLARLQPSRAMDVGGNTQLCSAWDQTNLRFQRLWARKLLAGVGG
jgi:phenylpropionate dioxygenase-like ring-hydroxylating dioxygenase large terminal subunit